MTKAELYQKACMLPLLPGVYIIRDKSDTIIYIGKAKRLRIRVSQYFREGVPHDNKVSQMIAHAYAFDVIVCQSEFEALVLEASQIKAHTPKYNILLKDDKGYPYIRLDTTQDYPRFTVVSRPAEDGARYFGPYMGRKAAFSAIDTISEALHLATCSRVFPRDIGKDRPCLNQHLGRCCAPCTGRVSAEEYRALILQAASIFEGGAKQLERELIDHVFRHKNAEIAAKSCLSGPHKDDLELLLDGRSASAFASQGQVRTCTLSLKLAERELFFEEDGEYPVLLLDDVLSELDRRRQDFVLNRISAGQVMITCCEDGISEKLRAGAAFHIKNGKIV